ncbi:right-handed parallel beta-helix repeat-containing protein [Streptomyces mutabilis]|uniref:right-handed parallel beta-helix repeat-containing protein n=1 Tax=Streptomyces mutabilis TaxID=67332 RepID=UPI00365D39D8
MRIHRARRSWLLCAALALGMTAAVPVAAAPAGTTTAGQYYVDCSRAVNGNGSSTQPFNTLAPVNSLSLGPSDTVRFKRGTTCTGTLAPQGDGAAGSRIVIGAYGPSGDPRPVIVGTATGTSAVTLSDMSHVVIQDLALRNPLPEPATVDRQGLFVTATTGVVEDVVAERLSVSNVVGLIRDQANFSGGIVFQATGTGKFDGVTVRNNVVSDLSNNGITVTGRTVPRPAADQPWPGATAKNVLVTHNLVRKVTGNGIIILNADSPVSSWNEVDRAAGANRGPFRDPVNRICNVGLWFWESNNALAEHNVVHDTVFKGDPEAPDGCDGEAFDMGDSSTDNTIYQYNISYNNINTILAVGSSDSVEGVPHRATFRYNLSINDKSIMGVVPGCATQQPDPARCNGDHVRIHNNTYISDSWPTTLLQDDPELSARIRQSGIFGGLQFKNNVLYATGERPDDFYFYCGEECSHNVFHGMPGHGTDAVLSDPKLVNPAAAALFKKTAAGAGPNLGQAFALAGNFAIKPGSPAACAGVPLAPLSVPMGNATAEFFGRAVQNPPSVGFAEAECG